MTQTAGETATFTALLNYGDTGADKIEVTRAGDGSEVQMVGLATTPASVDLSYAIDENTAAGNIVLTVALWGKEKVYEQQSFTITVEEKEVPTLTVEGLIKADNNFSIFAQALVQTGLLDDLAEEGPFTVFAPNDEAFEAFMSDLGIQRNELMVRSDLTDILKHHIVEERLETANISDKQSVTARSGVALIFSVTDGNVRVDDAPLGRLDLIGSNGVVHEVEEVLLPKGDIDFYESVKLLTPTSNDESKTFMSTANGYNLF